MTVRHTPRSPKVNPLETSQRLIAQAEVSRRAHEATQHRMAEAATERAQQEAEERARRAVFDATTTAAQTDRSAARRDALLAAGVALAGLRSALQRLETTGVHIGAAIPVINNIAESIGITN
ncbi:hypothetical protein [Stenotrophomonas sp. 9(2022)]|uniref:hypothetical protein n=1 Tax=Stenotrophomonas sp. 9(2022) TaxID=2950153 RepID=UPI0021157575|nr:hypothetical protein [Stenotrophomonas sp. 9(2022)]